MSKSELTELGERAVKLGATVKLTGCWLWADFDNKPTDQVRTELKKDGWKWASKKMLWYLAGKPCASKGGVPYYKIAAKYGEENIIAAV